MSALGVVQRPVPQHVIQSLCCKYPPVVCFAPQASRHHGSTQTRSAFSLLGGPGGLSQHCVGKICGCIGFGGDPVREPDTEFALQPCHELDPFEAAKA